MNKKELTISCDVCGKPAQVRHFPGMSPQSGSWCDYHYKIAAWVSPNGRYGVFLLLALTIAAIIFEIFAFLFLGTFILIVLGTIIFAAIFIVQNSLFFLVMKPRR